ncbi:MAG: hypothetical protein ACK5MU_04040 [Candidatus Saccharimonadales bacterium]
MTPDERQKQDARVSAFLRVFSSPDGILIREQFEEMRDARVKRAMDATTEFECLKETQRAAGIKGVLVAIENCFAIDAERKEKERKEAESNEDTDS